MPHFISIIPNVRNSITIHFRMSVSPTSVSPTSVPVVGTVLVETGVGGGASEDDVVLFPGQRQDGVLRTADAVIPSATHETVVHHPITPDCLLYVCVCQLIH